MVMLSLLCPNGLSVYEAVLTKWERGEGKYRAVIDEGNNGLERERLFHFRFQIYINVNSIHNKRHVFRVWQKSEWRITKRKRRGDNKPDAATWFCSQQKNWALPTKSKSSEKGHTLVNQKKVGSIGYLAVTSDELEHAAKLLENYSEFVFCLWTTPCHTHPATNNIQGSHGYYMSSF